MRLRGQVPKLDHCDYVSTQEQGQGLKLDHCDHVSDQALTLRGGIWSPGTGEWCEFEMTETEFGLLYSKAVIKSEDWRTGLAMLCIGLLVTHTFLG